MSHFTVLVIGEYPEDQLAPFQDNNMGDCPQKYLEFVEDEDGEFDETQGKKGYWENPDCRYDYYKLGGRWRGYFKLKEGKQGELGEGGVFENEPEFDADSALKGDIDWKGMGKDYETFAVVKDGEWYEKGEMGWFGCVNNEKEDEEWAREWRKLVKNLPDDTLLSVYDCHI